jgi:hypothetical protein
MSRLLVFFLFHDLNLESETDQQMLSMVLSVLRMFHTRSLSSQTIECFRT